MQPTSETDKKFTHEAAVFQNSLTGYILNHRFWTRVSEHIFDQLVTFGWKWHGFDAVVGTVDASSRVAVCRRGSCCFAGFRWECRRFVTVKHQLGP